MVIVYLNGGLANQLFQYASAKALSLHHQVPLALDISSFSRTELPELEVPRDFELYNFKGVNEIVLTKEKLENDPAYRFARPSWINKLLPAHKRNVYVEPHYHYDSNFFKAGKNVYLKGGWQSEKYFAPYREELVSILEMKEELVTRVKNKALEFQQQPTVGVHIRRGDYLRKQIILEWHGVLGRDYYAQAFEIMSKHFPRLKIAYFTDDVDWVEKELLPIAPGEIISGTISRTGPEDFYLMSQCTHNIIANSSFSWWAAWLNKNPSKMVIAPKKWFDKAPLNAKDVVPESWTRI
jgi:hypothetical protein